MNEELDNGYLSPTEFAARGSAWAQAQGAQTWWCAMQYNASNNAARSAAVRAAVNEKNGRFTIWFTRPFAADEARAACLESHAQGFIAEAEIPAHRPEAQNWSLLELLLRDIDIPKAVATNFAAFVHGPPEDDPGSPGNGYPWFDKAEPLVKAGWACLTEAYDLSGEPAAWPDRRAEFAKHLGWTKTQPILGTYGGRTLADFPSRVRYQNWSVWDAGSVL